MTNKYTPYDDKERWHLSKSINPLTLGVFAITVLTTVSGAYAYYNKDQQAQNTLISANAATSMRLTREVEHVRELQVASDRRQDEIRGLVREQLTRVESKLDNIENYLRDATK
ncbi:hypothetical protein [Gilvimarinus chinensis]|uniref:hypothetical protein n=1 Tax=Gilvimarinus chinensis TaxID=396005 RepID=UPI00037D8B15|nr:hypothetical protein [Gilvimarinus chinensis]